MEKRTRTKDNSNEAIEDTNKLRDTFNHDREAEIYDRFYQITNQYGTDLILRIYTIKGDDKRSLGFIDEIAGEEISLFLQNPEMFLKDRFGGGAFRVMVVNNTNKKFITNLTISISTPRNNNPSKTNEGIEDLSRARKEGRAELLEILNLSKTQTQSPLDFVKFFEIMTSQQDKIREREDKQREKELEFLKETTKQSTQFNEQFKPMFDFIGDAGNVFSGVMKVVDRSIRLAQEINPNTNETSVKDVLVDLAKTFINNPQTLSRFSMSNIPTPTPNESNLANPDPLTETPPEPSKKTITREENQTQPNQFNFDLALPAILIKYIKRGIRGEEPQFCADSILADLDDLLEDKLISEEQLQATYTLLISEQLLEHIKKIFPGIEHYKDWITQFQKEIYKIIKPPEETEEKEKQDPTPTQ